MRLAAAVPAVPADRACTRTTPTTRARPTAATRTTSCSATTPFADIVRHLTPFFVTRQVFTGAGRLGVGQDGRVSAFQISQRADFFEVEVGLETTLKRPDHQHPRRAARRPGAVPPAARHRRRRQPERHRDLPEDRHDRARPRHARGGLPDGAATGPRPARWRRCTRSPTTSSLAHEVVMTDGRRMTALQVQWELYALADEFCRRGDHADLDAATEELLDEWRQRARGPRARSRRPRRPDRLDRQARP